MPPRRGATPTTSGTPVQIRLTAEERAGLERLAVQRGSTLTTLIREAIDHYVSVLAGKGEREATPVVLARAARAAGVSPSTAAAVVLHLGKAMDRATRKGRKAAGE